jgi:hypothetical protein
MHNTYDIVLRYSFSFAFDEHRLKSSDKMKEVRKFLKKIKKKCALQNNCNC